MKTFSAVLSLLALLPAATAPALAQADTLQLSTAKVFADAAGAYVTVAVKNTGTKTVAEVHVTCEFFAGRRSLGKAATTVFSIVGGLTGNDQVRLLGGTGADRATCAITGEK